MTDPDATAGWRRQLAVIWVAQFLSIAAFCFGIPFVTYHIQALGIHDERQVLIWSAIFAGAAPITFCVAAPFWGSLADRFGRKRMLIRAQVCAVVVLLGMGWAPDVLWLIIFRIGQGLFTGTVPAAQTLVAVSTPAQRHGLALGALSSAVFGGASFGVFVGGYSAEHFGYGTSYAIGAGLALVAALIIAIGARERFVPPPPREADVRLDRLAAIRPGLPLLVLIAGTAIVMNIEQPVLPLLVQRLNGGIEGAAAIMGNLGAIGSIAAMIAGAVWGTLTDRIAPTRVATLCAVCAALACIPFALAERLGLHVLYVAKFTLAFLAAGLDPVFQVWLSKITAPERRGAVFGFASTARSIGWLGGPLLATAIVLVGDLGTAYWVVGVGFLALIPLMTWAARRMRTP